MGNPSRTPRGAALDQSGGQQNSAPTTRSQAQAQTKKKQEQGAKRPRGDKTEESVPVRGPL